MPLCWSPDGTTLAAGNAGYASSSTSSSGSYETLLYTANLSGPVANLPPTAFVSREIVQGVGWLSNNYLAIVTGVTGDYTKSLLTIWDIQQPQQKPFTIPLDYEMPTDFSVTINALAVSPKNSVVAMALTNGVLLGQVDTTHNPVTWRQVGSPLSFNNQDVGQIGWSGDGRYLAAVNSEFSGAGKVKVWDATQQYQPVVPDLDTSHISEPLTHLAWSPTSQTPLLALGGVGGQVYLWEPGQSAQPQRTLARTIGNKITALIWSYDGHWLAASYDDPAATILIWRM
jgi:WD40 repeat protein